MEPKDKTAAALVIVIWSLICERIVVPIIGFLGFPLPYYYSLPSVILPLVLLLGSILLLIRSRVRSQRPTAIFGIFVSIVALFLWGVVYFSSASRKNCIQSMAPNADLRGCNLTHEDFYEIDLSGADLSDANLSGSSFVGGSFLGANLSGASLRDANISHASLIDANLQGVFIFHADLTGADLSGVDLSEASITGTSLVDSILVKADLSGSDIGFCDFTNANLDSAILQGADIHQSIFANASVKGAVFDETRFCSNSEMGEDFASSIKSWKTPDGQNLNCGCGGPLIMASPYKEGGHYHPALMVSLPGETDADALISKMNADWGPSDLRELELLVCSSGEQVQIKTCGYAKTGSNTPSKFVERYQYEVTVTIYLASTFEKLAERTFQGPVPSCPIITSFDETYSAVKGDRVIDPDPVTDWISGYVYP